MDKYTKEQRAEALEILTEKGAVDIMSTEEFMSSYEPFEIAKMVRGSKLNLDREYIRVNPYYVDTCEADTMTDLVSAYEVEDALDL